uniref:MCF.2 cell line derived transforming sequence like n=1 Tax=Paramormyrops kingsleyae TaxID=1676925 RepID=A0A3B3SLP6_9TELE
MLRRTRRRSDRRPSGTVLLPLLTLRRRESDPGLRTRAPASKNEIMQAESRPLCASDITFQLQKQFAFLPGGRQDGCPIIVFPEFPTFGDLPEEEFHSVLTYLTSVPSLNAAGVGFVLVIDRRLDKWASVKATLLRIAVSYPPCCLPSLSQSVKQFVLSSVKVR